MIFNRTIQLLAQVLAFWSGRKRLLITGLCLAGFQLAQAQAGFPNNMMDDEDELLSGGNAASTGVSTWLVSEPYLNLWVFDQPLTYHTSYGKPIGFAVSFKQRNARSNAKIFGLGPSWESSWLSYIEYTNGVNAAAVTVGATYVPLGGRRDYVPDGTTKEFKSTSTMTKLADGGGNLTGFQINYADGSRHIYSYSLNISTSENYAFLKHEIDPFGRTNVFNYDTISNVVRLRTMVDSDNRINTVRYLDATFTSQISEVENHYGGKATFSYDGTGKLTGIVNVGNLSDAFEYNAQGLITKITTPYGDTTFTTTTNTFAPYNLGGNNEVNRSVTIIEADGTKQLYLYRDQSTKLNPSSGTDLIPTAYPSGEVPNTSPLASTLDNTGMDARNSFHWNAKQYSGLSANFKSTGNFNDLTVADYRIAQMKHWLRGYNNAAIVSESLSLQRTASPDGTVEGQKSWFDYAGKVNVGGGNWGTRGTFAGTLFGAMVLPDATTRFEYTERNQWEKPTTIKTTYTSGGSVAVRTSTMAYTTDGIDVTEVRGPSNELLASNSYSGAHQVLTHYNGVNDRTDFTYDSQGRLTSMQHPTGLVTTNYYFISGTHIGWLEKTIDFETSLSNAFRTNSFTYDKGLVASKIDERNLTTGTTWDPLQRVMTATLPIGTFSKQYNKLDLEKVTDPMAFTNHVIYDQLSRVCCVTDARGTNSLRLFYTMGMVSAATNGVQQTNGFTYDFNGNLLKTTYHDGSILTAAYNLLGQRTSTTDAAATSITYTYNNQGLLATSSSALGQLLAHKYDSRDRLIEATDANGIIVTNTYDNLGRVLSRTYPDGGVEKLEYSARGLITSTNQLNFVTRFGYDALGRKTAETNANNEVTRYTYNAAGDLRSLEDGKNQITRFGYDVYGRMTSKTNAANVEILRYQYDSAGRLTTRWSVAKGTTTYTHDSNGNVTAVDSPSSADVSFAYDGENRATQMTDAIGTTAYTYTSFGALLTENGPWASDTITYSYKTNHLRANLNLQQPNAFDWAQSYGYDTANRLTNVNFSAGSVSYLYDGTRKMRVQKVTFPNTAYINNYFDTAMGRLTQSWLNTYGYNTNAHLYAYNVGGQKTKATHQISYTPGNYVDYTYDPIGQLKTATGWDTYSLTRKQEQLGYVYDAAGNLGTRTNNALVQSFTSNNLNEFSNVSRTGTLTLAGRVNIAVTSVSINGSTSGVEVYQDQTFAKTGLSLADGLNTSTAVTQDPYGRLDTNVVSANLPVSVNFSYDSNGNLTSDGQRSFTYDDENQLTKVELATSWKSEFAYDGANRRRWKKEYTWAAGAWQLGIETRYVYDGNLVNDYGNQ